MSRAVAGTSRRHRWSSAVAALSAAFPRGAIVLSVLTFSGYAMGLVRDRLFARTFGAGAELDAYNAAFVLPELALDVLVAGGLVAAFVPVFTSLKGEVADARPSFGGTILTLAIAVMAVVTMFLFVFAPQTTSLIAPGFTGSQRELYIELFRVMCITPAIFAASIVLGEVLVAERRFLTYGLAPLLYNGGIVVGVLLLADRIGILAAAVGAVAGALAHLAIRVWGIRRTTYRPRLGLALRSRGVGTFVRLMIPKMLSHPIEPLTFLYYTALASTLAPGSVSSVSFARNFQSVPVSLIGASFAIAAFPVLSTAAAAGDRRAFSRVLGTNLVTITVLTTAAALGLFVIGGAAIRILLGGGAFGEEDIALTTSVLALFAFAIPLESLTHLLSRALYSTQNTILPTLASIAAFVTIVLSGNALAPSIGLSAVPASFALGMAVKVLLLSAALIPRIGRIGAPRPARSQLGRLTLAASSTPRALRGRPAKAFAGLALVALAVGAIDATSQALSDATLAVAPVITPWPRLHAPTPPITVPVGSMSPAPASSSTSIASSSPSPVATQPPGPFVMDLYERGDYVGEFKDTWCLSAAMQTMMNIMDDGADRTKSTQARLFTFTRSLAPAPDGAAEPEGWAQGLTELDYGRYKVSVQPSIRAAIQLAARQLRATNRPVGLLVWRGAHSWVMSGFKATADPALTDRFTVTGVRIEDVWYPRFSTIWGYSQPPDAFVPVDRLSVDYKPWRRPQRAYPDKDGKYVLVIPVAG